MAAVCPKIQNGGQNDAFWPNENMTLYTNSYCDLSVYFAFLVTKNTFPSFSKFKMAVMYKKIQNGRQNNA